ncbi:MAG: hypothetical protein MUO81_08410 [Thermoplasmata archaeon]|nr:hypothetical protein [Thermoplasmata archaeon]
MRVGNIDGNGVIYRVLSRGDPKGVATIYAGDIILEGGERLVAVLRDTRLGLMIGWKSVGRDDKYPSIHGDMTPFHSYDGPGSLYITDRRIVFLRRPDLKEIRGNRSGEDMGVGSDLARARSILSANGLEYCEIKFEDIADFKEKRGGTRLYLSAGGQQYHVSLDKEEADALVPLLKKRFPDSGHRAGLY